MTANEIMRRDALDHLRITADLAHRYGCAPAEIREAVEATLPDAPASGMEALHSALRREIIHGTSRDRILALVHDMLGTDASVSASAPVDESAPVEASPFNIRRDEHGVLGLYAGDAWITDDVSALAEDAGSVEERRTALDGMLAVALRPLFDESVVTR